MSDSYGGRGWWLANDGKWYPPVASDEDGESEERADPIVDLTGPDAVIELRPPPPPKPQPRWGAGRRAAEHDQPDGHES